jgi:hypothetical protein
MCAAQYIRLTRDDGFVNRGVRTAADLNTTLVLDRDLPVFSTDAGNSALIFKRKSPRYHAVPIGVTSDGGKNTRTKATILAQQRGILCHGANCLDGNS